MSLNVDAQYSHDINLPRTYLLRPDQGIVSAGLKEITVVVWLCGCVVAWLCGRFREHMRSTAAL